MDRGMTDKKETILIKSWQVMVFARKLADDIYFLAPIPTKPDEGSSPPTRSVLGQIAENLIQTQNALIAADEKFAQIKSRIA